MGCKGINEIMEGKRPVESKVTRNKNNKTISVSNAFDEGEIPVKLIAPYEKWLEFEDIFLKNDEIAFLLIKTYISRPTLKSLGKLEYYSSVSPREFSEIFYNRYIWEANLVNPRNPLAARTRGTLYSKSKAEMVKIRYTAMHLYVFF